MSTRGQPVKYTSHTQMIVFEDHMKHKLNNFSKANKRARLGKQYFIQNTTACIYYDSIVNNVLFVWQISNLRICSQIVYVQSKVKTFSATSYPRCYNLGLSSQVISDEDKDSGLVLRVLAPVLIKLLMKQFTLMAGL